MIDKNLFKLLGKNKKYIFIVVVLEIISLLSQTAFSYSIADSISKAFTNSNNLSLELFKIDIIILFISLIIRFILDIVIVRIKDILSRNVKKELRERIFNSILENGFNYSFGMSGLTQLSMEGIEQLDTYYSEYIPQFFYAVIAPFVLFFISLFFNYIPAIALILFVPLIPISIIMVSKYAKKIFAKYWNKYLSMGDSFLDASSGLKDLKIFLADKKKHQEMNKEAEGFRKITMKVLVMELASTTIMDLVAYGGAAIGIAIALINLKNGTYTNLCGVIFLTLIAIEYFLPMRRFGSAFHIGMNGATAGRKILQIINKESIPFGNDPVNDYSIDINDLTFSYDNKNNVLNDINMHFNSKGLYSIVGVSGSGKSTIVKLLKGEVKALDNQIKIGGINLYDLSKVSYYSHLGVISYNSYILDMSIRDNFKLFKSDISDDEIYKYLKMVNLYDFVKRSGDLDLIIKEDSNNISGGERQRLALSLALCANKDIYIFDEATSSIDIDSEKIIMNNIKELSKDKLVILISHRLANVINSDMIYYIESGRVLECGKHQELIDNNMGYNKMYLAQVNEENKYKEVLNYE